MKFRNTLFLLVVVLVLLLGVYLLEIRKPGESSGKSKNVGETLAIETSDINRIELSYAAPDYQRIVCSRDDNGVWWLQQPVVAEADQHEVKRLISSSMSKIVKITVKSSEDLAGYGLDNPRVTAVFGLKDGTSRALMLGATVPTGNYAYVKIKGKPEIYLIPASIVDDLTKFVSDLRDRTVMALDELEIQKIELRYLHGDDIVCQKRGFEWEMVKPLKTSADTGEVENVISAIRDLRAETFVTEEPEDLSEYGLSQPGIQVFLTDDNGKSRALLVGKRQGNSVYVKTSLSDSVYLVDSGIVDKLTRDVFDLRNKEVLVFDTKAAQRLVLKSMGRTIVLEKKSKQGKETWVISQPVKANADNSQIEHLLVKLRDLKVLKFISDQPRNLTDYGLDPALITVVVSLEGAKEETLLVGKKVGKSVYAGKLPVKSVFAINADIVNDLEKGTLDLRDKQVMKFDQKDVNRFELGRKGEAIVCIKQEHDWRITKPIRAKAKNYKIDDILKEMADLKAQKFISEKADHLSEYGLSQPSKRVSLAFKDGSSLELILGKESRDGESVYAKVSDSELIFVLDKKIAKQLDIDAKDLEAR